MEPEETLRLAVTEQMAVAAVVGIQLLPVAATVGVMAVQALSSPLRLGVQRGLAVAAVEVALVFCTPRNLLRREQAEIMVEAVAVAAVLAVVAPELVLAARKAQ